MCPAMVEIEETPTDWTTIVEWASRAMGKGEFQVVLLPNGSLTKLNDAAADNKPNTLRQNNSTYKLFSTLPTPEFSRISGVNLRVNTNKPTRSASILKTHMPSRKKLKSLLLITGKCVLYWHTLPVAASPMSICW